MIHPNDFDEVEPGWWSTARAVMQQRPSSEAVGLSGK